MQTGDLEDTTSNDECYTTWGEIGFSIPAGRRASEGALDVEEGATGQHVGAIAPTSPGIAMRRSVGMTRRARKDTRRSTRTIATNSQ